LRDNGGLTGYEDDKWMSPSTSNWSLGKSLLWGIKEREREEERGKRGKEVRGKR
jgi:hypothetical protein